MSTSTNTVEATIAPICDQEQKENDPNICQQPLKLAYSPYYVQEFARLKAFARDPENPLNLMIAHQKRNVRKWKNASPKSEKSSIAMKKKVATSTKKLEILKKNHRILMNFVNIPIGRLPDDHILMRIKFLKIYTNYPFVQIFEIPEDDRELIRTLGDLPMEENDESLED